MRFSKDLVGAFWASTGPAASTGFCQIPVAKVNLTIGPGSGGAENGNSGQKASQTASSRPIWTHRFCGRAVIRMATLAELRETTPIVFDVQRSDVSIQARFRTHLWSLFHNIPALYEALLTRLAEFGLTPQGIKSDVADGSLGAYNVNFWLLGFRALVRIRLENLEIQFNGVIQGDVDVLERIFVRVSEALDTSTQDFGVSSYAVDIGLHGPLTGIEPKDYVATFVTRVPPLLGPFIGSGAVFYFGEEGDTTLRTITADLSGYLPGKLYIRVYAIYKDTVRPQTLKTAVEEHMAAALRSLGLRTGSS